MMRWQLMLPTPFGAPLLPYRINLRKKFLLAISKGKIYYIFFIPGNQLYAWDQKEPLSPPKRGKK